jgi:3-hydroxybutyryl-CoA dehydrogenase
MEEPLGIAGSGQIATGLAAAAAELGQVVLWARSDASAAGARAAIDKACERIDGDVDPGNVRVVTDLDELGAAAILVEAVVENLELKAELWQRLSPVARPDALLCSTTSSLSVQALAEASGDPQRFVGLHVFHPVPRMQLVELAFPGEASAETRRRAQALCEELGKTVVTVPDMPGFVVNRLLFPALFSAVVLMEESGLEPEAIDTCMQLGVGHPMGPLTLLDYIGLDIAEAIGDTIGTEVPARVRALVAQGDIGKKSGRGIYDYSGDRPVAAKL